MKPSAMSRRCFIFTECTSDRADFLKIKFYKDNAWMKGVILIPSEFDKI